ncbi:MAG: SDR family oxidoreductase [Actinomycetota bacterium]|nr:MAG: SDR family oxidoreductase [Actinomycetota bacterium]
MLLEDRVAIVTGGGKGIGSIYSQGLAREGAKVVVADIDFTAAKEVAERIRADGADAIAVDVDIASPESTVEMARAANSTFGRIDILINNASLMSALPRRPWHEIPVGEWDAVMAVNLRGMFLCCLAVFPTMKDRRYGKIVNISSSRIYEGMPNRLHYTTSKAGVVGFTRALAREVGEDNICVNAISPGFTQSDTQVATSSAEYMKAHIDRRCFKREEYPQDLVGTVIFLSSSQSDFMTGQLLNVDGGYSMH